MFLLLVGAWKIRWVFNKFNKYPRMRVAQFCFVLHEVRFYPVINTWKLKCKDVGLQFTVQKVQLKIRNKKKKNTTNCFPAMGLSGVVETKQKQ